VSHSGQDDLAAVPRVSFAQNGEDILLDRVFESRVGTYMDVGACYPTIHNNTHFFYLRGWRGVNIEPLPWLHAAFDEKRPEDLNLSVAAGETEGEMPFYEVSSSGGLSTLSKQFADTYRAQGLDVIEHRIPVRTVAALVEEYAIAPPDFLSIDAEGTEAQVIRGLPLAHWRPRVIIVESTWPQTTIPSHESWEPILLAHGYLFAAFNGVNRFYLRDDFRDKLCCFATPVSALDHYVLAEVVDLQEQVRSLREQSIQWEIDRSRWRDHCELFDRQREEFESQRAEYLRGYAEFARGYAGFENDRAGFERDRAGFERDRAEFERERAEFDRGRAEFERERKAFEAERAGFIRHYAESEAAYKRYARELDIREVQKHELERELAAVRRELAASREEFEDLKRLHAAHKAELTGAQRLLRPYRLIDRLGIVTAGYSLARRIKRNRAV
jgi:FkbM family methyltransferase